MEPWSFGADGKVIMFSDEMGFPGDVFARSRKAVMELEARLNYDFENSGIVSDEVAVQSVDCMDLGLTDIMRKRFHNNLAVEEYGGEVGGGSGKRVASSTCMVTPCKSPDSSLIDLKLGRLVDHNGANSKFSNGRSVIVAKRAHTASSCTRTPFCRVQGCYMDLSSSKEYHKKHKVCDAHSKTARVIVDGIEQRFCQQCSRFHLLVEFDDGKRSCRKRLAGHNKRRRKPQLHSFSGKPRSRFLATSLPRRSHFAYPNIDQSGILCHDKYGEANPYHHMQVFNPKSTVPMMNLPFLANSIHLHNAGKQHYYGDFLDAASNVQELSGASNSSCALSLLSTQSNDFSTYRAGIPTGDTQFHPGEHSDHVGDQISERRGNYAATGFYSSTTNPIDVEQMESIMFSDASHPNYGVHSLSPPLICSSCRCVFRESSSREAPCR